jgi:hypothetical protein
MFKLDSIVLSLTFVNAGKISVNIAYINSIGGKAGKVKNKYNKLKN